MDTLRNSVGMFLKICGSAAGVTLAAGSTGLELTGDLAKKQYNRFKDRMQCTLPENWLEDTLVLAGTSLPGLREKTASMRNRLLLEHPDLDRTTQDTRLCSMLIKEHSLRIGVVGGLTASPAALPGAGTLTTVAVTMAADLMYMLRSQIELCYAISTIYDTEMDSEELQAVVLALIGFSTTSQAVKGVSAEVIREIINSTASQYLKIGITQAGTAFLKKLGVNFGSKGLRLIPFINIPLSVSVNVASTMMVGKQARHYFNAAKKAASGDHPEEHPRAQDNTPTDSATD